MFTVNLADVEVDQVAADSLRNVICQLRAAKRIVVVCGAGISTSVGIPDFRSSSGLFSSSNGTGKGKGKAQDLFHIRSLTVSHPKLNPANESLQPCYQPITLFLTNLYPCRTRPNHRRFTNSYRILMIKEDCYDAIHKILMDLKDELDSKLVYLPNLTRHVKESVAYHAVYPYMDNYQLSTVHFASLPFHSQIIYLSRQRPYLVQHAIYPHQSVQPFLNVNGK